MMSTNNDIQKIKWFWAWQDEKREQWLSEMAQQGWHLDSISMLGLAFNFKAGEPGDFVYRLDIRLEKKEKIQDYVEFIQDAGWDYVGNFFGWLYFRKENSTGESSEIFTDNESKIEKYKRLRTLLFALSPGYIVVFLANLEKYPLWFAILLVSTYLLLAVFVGTSLVGISLRISELERNR